MRALIQRVKQASVAIEGEEVAQIYQGLLVFVAIQALDNHSSADKLLNKLLRYRVFADASGKMNLSLQDVRGGLLIVSQFTLAADTTKGLRPGFSSAAQPQQAQLLYAYFVACAQHQYAAVQTGVFGADMQVSLINDGPVTFLLEA